ncbi:MAG TPA: ATP-binding cassette domain-containing protein [Micromonosporaceae bacterium]|nr:ATP-binding cassette domain-containing protein [Micromonosporaceae bacterium]
MAEQLAVESIGIGKSYGGLPVLRGIDLAIPSGTVFALLGPNGAGKTTMVRILSTLAAADTGTARVAGFDVATQRHDVRCRISLTGQYVALDELCTGAENLRTMARLAGLRGRAARSRADELLDRFGLVDAGGRLVRTYSGGMRRRLDLAAGLVGGPSVIFLDEPTTGLDLRSRQAVWQVVSGLAESGATVFLTTQYLEEADLLADRVAVLDGGHVVADGTVAELKQQVADQRLELGCADRRGWDAVLAALGGHPLTSDAGRLTIAVATDGTAGHIRHLLDRVDPDGRAVARFAVRTATLDDVFLALTGHTTTSDAATPDAASTPEKETADV